CSVFMRAWFLEGNRVPRRFAAPPAEEPQRREEEGGYQRERPGDPALHGLLLRRLVLHLLLDVVGSVVVGDLDLLHLVLEARRAEELRARRDEVLFAAHPVE